MLGVPSHTRVRRNSWLLKSTGSAGCVHDVHDVTDRFHYLPAGPSRPAPRAALGRPGGIASIKVQLVGSQNATATRRADKE